MTKIDSDDRRQFLLSAAGVAAAGLAGLTPTIADAMKRPQVVSSEGRRNVIIDCDPGQDDAVNIMFMLGATDRLNVLAITTVAGNVGLDLTERNARIVRDWVGATHWLPVYAGCPRPLMRDLVNAADVHGQSGLDGVQLHEPLAPLAKEHAVDYLISTLREAAPSSITLCATGPLTNIATALICAPDIKTGIREIVMMGGAYFERGNATPAAEFNMYVDPQAAKVVFESGIPIVVLPRDVAVKAMTTPDRIAPIRALGGRCATAVADILTEEVATKRRKRGVEQCPMYDPMAGGYLIDPSLFKGRRVNVVVETIGDFTLGETVVDWESRTERKPNAWWITDVDADGFYEALRASISTLP
jgi:purine nucleosidase